MLSLSNGKPLEGSTMGFGTLVCLLFSLLATVEPTAKAAVKKVAANFMLTGQELIWMDCWMLRCLSLRC